MANINAELKKNVHDNNIMSILHEYKTLKTSYFPRWDRNNMWHCVHDSGIREGGRCEFVKKIIRVNASQSNIQLILVHEICHSVTRLCGHGMVWQKRMLVAAKEARKLVNLQLAQKIEEEVCSIKQTLEFDPEERPSIRDVVNFLKDVVLDVKETPTFNRTVAYIADNFGVTKKEILATYSVKTLMKEYGKVAHYKRNKTK